MTYDDLLREADSHNLITKEKPLQAYDGRILGNRIALRRGLSELEKKCVLAEELGHYHTTSGDILVQNNVSDHKQELHARLWAYNKLIGLTGILQAYQAGCRNIYEMAEYLDVTEALLTEAIASYKRKYGIFTTLDNYVIYFEPSLGVFELI